MEPPVRKLPFMQLLWSNKSCGTFSRISTALVMLVLPTVAVADAVQWTEAEGGNGHWYAMVTVDDAVTWLEADLLTEDVGAYLVTCTSAEENDFIRNTWVECLGDPLTSHAWLGLYKNEAGSFVWVTGEPLVYDDWVPGDPNDSSPNAVAQFYHSMSDGCGWADSASDDTLNSSVIEWSADCNGDGIVDYGQILDGTYADNDGNGVPDDCDPISPYQTIDNPDPGSNLIFADAVAVDGDHAVATARGFDGLIYFYKRTNGVWSVVDTAVLPVDTLGLPESGYAGRTGIALVNDVAIVGAGFGGAGEGQARIYRRSGETWSLEQTIDSTGPSGQHGATFAENLDYDGTTLVISAYQEKIDGIADAGATYFYQFDGSQWAEVSRVVSTDIDAYGYFGSSVAVHGNFAAVASNDNFNNRGIVELLKWNGDDWTIVETLLPPDGVADDDFGQSVALVGNRLLVNQNLATVNGIDDAGCVWLYELNADGTANEPERIISPTPHMNEEFGRVIDLSSDGIFIGGGRPVDGMLTIARFSWDPAVGITLTHRYDSMEPNVEDGFMPARSIGTDGQTLMAGLTGDGQGVVQVYDAADDCNDNGVPDDEDIANGYSQDCNADGIPDECQEIGGGNIWSNPLGGDLMNAANWANCEAPGPDSDLVFPLSDNYTVACPSAQIGSASVTDGSVVFLLDGVLTVEPADIYQNALSISAASPTTSLTLRSGAGGNGELDCHLISIADGGNSHGMLIVEGEGTTLRLGNDPATINVGPVGVGLMTLTDGATMTTANIVLGQNQASARGELLIDNNATLNVGIQLTIENNSKATVMGGGTVVSEPASIGILVNHGGRLSGEGVVDADVRNYGVVETLIGQPLHVLKNYFQPAPSTLAFSGSLTAGISGPSTWSSVHSDKEALIAGLLDLTIDAAYTPAVDSQWPVLTAGYGINGTFDVALVTGLPDDMYADIVYSNALGGNGGDTVTVVFGSLDAPLAFDSPSPVTLNATPTAMLLQDLDGDGADELIITTAGDPGVVLVYPNEGGLFASDPLSLSVGPSPVALVAGDFTGDGEIEIASADAVDGTITFIRDPLGDSEIVTYQTDGGGMPVSLAAGNFLDDGVSDELAVACAGTDTIEFWQHDAGLRTLNFSLSVFVDLDDTPGGIDPGQVNEDKDAFVPLAVTLPAAGGVVVLDNDGNGGFPASETYPAGVDSAQVRMANLDGLATTPNDLVVLNQTDGTISILLDQGNGYLPAANLPVGQSPDSIDLADLDADGDQDIVLVAIDSPTGESTVLILRNDFVPTGQLVFAPAAHLELPPGTIPVLVGDGAVDFDVYPDLITINDGGAGFRSGVEASFSIARNNLCNFPNCAGDFNVDGLVGVDDLLALLDGFGTSDGDVDCDGISDINDLLVLIGNWGPCN